MNPFKGLTLMDIIFQTIIGISIAIVLHGLTELWRMKREEGERRDKEEESI